MKIIYNNIIPFKGFAAINLFGVLFVRKDSKITPIMINHEEIHTKQMKELLYIFFYVWYIIEWIIRVIISIFTGKDAYRNISFEREAYANEKYAYYIEIRKRYSWTKYLFK